MKKQKRFKEPKYESDDKQEIIRFIVILVVVLLVILGFYLFTKFVVKKPKIDYTDTVTEGEINYSVVTVGTMFSKSDSKYYVLAYDFEDKLSVTYGSIKSEYEKAKESLPLYELDLSNYLNKEYITTKESNKNAKTISELAINGPTLIKVEKGKIIKYMEGENSIRQELGL